jgi:hypothetical protein
MSAVNQLELSFADVAQWRQHRLCKPIPQGHVGSSPTVGSDLHSTLPQED